MKFGIDRLIAEPQLRAALSGKRVALLAHPASVTADLTHSVDALMALGDPIPDPRKAIDDAVREVIVLESQEG